MKITQQHIILFIIAVLIYFFLVKAVTKNIMKNNNAKTNANKNKSKKNKENKESTNKRSGINEFFSSIGDAFWWPRYHSIPYGTHTNFLFWNTQLGSTRNMSYDLRGDVSLAHTYTGPWNNPTRFPIRNRPLY
jgi:hypothetical protein